MLNSNATMLICGYTSLSGRALYQYLVRSGFTRVYTDSTAQLNLLDHAAVRQFIRENQPEYVILTHIQSGGIAANLKAPADLMYTNLQAQTNIIQTCYAVGVPKLLFLGSSCAYPRVCPQPMKEEYLLTGPLEPSSEPYAVAKLAGIKLCQAFNAQYGTRFISLIPATLYGPQDHFDEHSHVLSALVNKFHTAKHAQQKVVSLWGTGTPRREFLYVDDFVTACLCVLAQDQVPDLLNVGSGTDLTIQELAELVRAIVRFEGEIRWDRSKPDGAYQKLLDSSRIHQLDWSATTTLRDGLTYTYQWYQQHDRHYRK
jgi:GDP-L-fucose synthase